MRNLENMLRIKLYGADGPSESTKEFTRKSLEKILEVVSEESLEAISVVCKCRQNGSVKAELTITVDGHTYKKSESGEDYKSVLLDVVDNIYKQVLRGKQKRIDKARRKRKFGKVQLKESIYSEEKENLIKAKSVVPVEVSEETAIDTLERSSRDIFIYIDRISKIPTILRRAEDGGYKKTEIIRGY